MANPPTLNPSSATFDGQSFHILIVDDDLVILNLLRDVLAMVPGCRITTVSNPGDAMAAIVKGDVDIVFTDVHMPGVTGLELLEDIVSIQKSPEIIVMTAYPSGEIAQQAMELGATSLLAKPFEDIAMVELELEKAIKRILRQRASVKATLPAVAASAPPVPSAPPAPVAKSVQSPPAKSGAEVSGRPTPMNIEMLEPRKIFDVELLEPFISVEIPRAIRYSRPFAIGFIDIPENLSQTLPSEQEKYRKQQIEKIERCLRRSDVMLDSGKDGMAVILYECNRLGAEVVEHKLRTTGFQHVGFQVFPMDAKEIPTLVAGAKKDLQNKRKFQIALLEPEEFFGRIVQNMLLDPKYHVNWVRSLDDAYKLVSREAENLKLLLLSLSKDSRQWELLLKFKKENLVQWPIVLFVDIPLTAELKKQLRQLGVRAVVNKSLSQEEFIYIVQSFVLPRPHIDERKNFRALVAVPVVYDVDRVSQSSNSFTLSRDGIFIRDMNPPASGTHLQLKLYIPGRNEAVECEAEVIYAVPYFVGVNRFHVSGFAAKFVGLDATQKDIVEKFVTSCLTTYLI